MFRMEEQAPSGEQTTEKDIDTRFLGKRKSDVYLCGIKFNVSV